MDINENLTQINTFTGGMNTDTSDAMLDNKQYRFARNLRINTNKDNNSGELHLIEGTVPAKCIDNIKDEIGEIFATTSIRDYGILLTRSGNMFDPIVYEINIDIYMFNILVTYRSRTDNIDLPDDITISMDLNVGNSTRYTIPYTIKLKKGEIKSGKYVELKDYDPESKTLPPINKADNIKIEINTKNREYHCYIGGPCLGQDPYLININEGVSEKKEGQSWSIYRFTKEDNSAVKIFGPCTEPIWENETDKPSLLTRFESDDNIKLYIADGIHLLLCINIVNHDNVESDIKYLYSRADAALSPLRVSISENNGLLKPARVQYCYRLYKDKGKVTKLSSFSKILSLYKDEKSGYPNNEYTGRSVEIQLPDEEYTNLNKIQIFRISYVLNGQLPEVHVIADRKYIRNQKIIDTGYNDLRSISVSELLSYLQLQIVPKTIESKNDYLFASNIKYLQNEVDKLFEDIDTRSFSSGMYTIKNGIKTKITEIPSMSETLYHEAFDIENLNTRWNEAHWKNDKGNFGGYGKYFNWTYSYTENEINQNKQSENYKNLISGLRPEEVYRFGVILYDKDGNASSVKWIADILMPNQSYKFEDGNVNVIINQNNPTKDIYNPTFTVRNMTISFTLNKQIPNCSKWEIVRCNRNISDKFTISEGLIGFPLKLENTNKICPSGFFTLDYLEVTNENGDNTGTLVSVPDLYILQFASPEYCYQEDDMQNLINLYKNSINVTTVRNYGCPSYLYSKSATTGSVSYSIIGNSLSNTKKSIAFYAENKGITNYPIYNFIKGFNLSIDLRLGSDGKVPSIPIEELAANIYNYILPYSIELKKELISYILDVAYPNVPEYNRFSEQDSVRFQDDVTFIGGMQYIGWSAPNVLESDFKSDSLVYKTLTEIDHNNFSNWIDDASKDEDARGLLYGIGTCGKCALLKLDNYFGAYNSDFSELDTKGYGKGLLSIQIADIRKQTTPYGGYNKEAIENSVYYSYGNVFSNDPQTIKFDGGDCYFCMFTYAALHNWYDTKFTGCNRMSTVYNVPIISDIDLHGRYGYEFNPNAEKCYYLQDTACYFDGYTQNKDLYLYNTAYNQYSNVNGFTSKEDSEYDDETYDTRVHYSEQKTNGESIDNWTQFKAMNFLDVDSRHGAITGLRLFKDKLIFWLNNSTGLLSVNERMLLNDADNALIILGTGSVLERYDYFTTQYGMKPNIYVDTQSDSSLYWWDGYRKEILQYTDKYAVTPLTTVKSVRNYINEHDEITVPTIFYDPTNKEIVCNVVNDESIVYSEQISQFSSVYDFSPISSVILNEKIYTFNKNNIYSYNNIEENKAKLFEKDIHPYIKYIVNKNNTMNKVYDIQTMGGRFYGGDDLKDLNMTFKTPLKQEGTINGKDITNREYDFRLNIPRSGKSDYGDRLRGKTMQCELSSSNNSYDFSLQYIITKFRISWS